MAELFELPEETSWKLLAVSPDMMDTQFCNRKFPFRWRSSLAVSVYEPGAQVLPDHLCEGRISFLKVSATITGYQPSREERGQGEVEFPNIPTEELNTVIDEYFACYGAMLQVMVSPNTDQNVGLDKYPHIIDFQPKNREIIQATSESAELLLSSKPKVNTSRSFTQVDETTSGWKIGAEKGPFKGELSHSNKESDSDNWSISTEASQERKETQGSTTQVSQLYNLLTGYHQYTNRAVFLMLARPHILEPTDHRTFVDGLRKIEGTQQFFLVVARPPEMEGLNIELSLNTGHFPEGLSIEEREEEYELGFEDFTVDIHLGSRLLGSRCTNIEDNEFATFTIDTSQNRVIDRDPDRGSDPGHPGITELSINNESTTFTPTNYNYRAISDTTVQISGRFCVGWGGPGKRFNRTFRVFTRSQTPKPSTAGDSVPLENLFITNRGLCVSFKSGSDCPNLDRSISFPNPEPGEFMPRILTEQTININPNTISKQVLRRSRDALNKELLEKIERSLINSNRHAFKDAIGFLDTDYFVKRLCKLLPRDYLSNDIGFLRDLGEVQKKLGGFKTVGDVLSVPLRQLMDKTGLQLTEAINLRRKIIQGH